MVGSYLHHNWYCSTSTVLCAHFYVPNVLVNDQTYQEPLLCSTHSQHVRYALCGDRTKLKVFKTAYNHTTLNPVLIVWTRLTVDSLGARDSHWTHEVRATHERVSRDATRDSARTRDSLGARASQWTH